jgi:hypothetical protein
VLLIVSGALFLGVVAPSIAIDDFTKGFYMWTTWDTYGQELYVDQVWEVCGMLIGFSPAGYTSIRISTTLGYEYRLFVVVIM